MNWRKKNLIFGEKGFFTQNTTLTPRNEFNLVFIIPDVDKKIKRIETSSLSSYNL